ncbi:serine-rich adhesin for platelets-like isoform X2 [Argopecten irradians]|uniref:serine-rich adhesin for platelets-like isoform X2 n=1 Tax=Argopecten irradians TaxID=31199 RepID=UPI00371578D5
MATLLKQILESQRNKQGGPKAAHAIWELKTLITYLEKKKQKAGKKSLQPVNINTHIINSGNTGLIDEHTGSPEGMQNIAEVLRQIQASQTGPDSDVEALQGNVWISSSTSSTSHSGGQGQVPAGADMALLALTSGDSGMSGVSGSTTEQKLTTLIQELSKSANGPASEAELAMLVQRLAELQTGSQTGSKGGSQAITEQYSRTRQSGRPGFHRGIDGSFLRIMKTSSSSTTSSRNSSPKISNSISHSSGRNTHAAANHGRSHVSSSRSSSKISKSSESLKADRSFGGSSHKSSRNSSKSTKSYKKNNSSEKQSSSSKQSRQSKKQQLINKMKAQGSTQKEQYILLFNEGKTKRVSLTDLRKKLRPLVMSKGEYTTEEGISKGINEIVQKLRIESQRRMETGSGDTDTFVINGMHIEYDHPARAGSTGLSPRGVARGGPIDPATISNFSPSQVLKNTLAALVGQRSVTPESPATGNSLTETGTQNQFLDSFFSMPQEQGGQTADMSAAQAFRIAAASSLLGQIPPSVDTHTSPNKMGTGSTTSTTVISSSGTQNNPPGTTGGSNTKHVSITSQTTSSTGSPANTVYHQTGSSPAKQPAVMIPDQTSATQLATESQYGPGAPVEATLSGVKSNTAHQASDLINFIIANEAAHQNTAVVNSLNQDVKGAGVNTARNNMLASTITDIITSDPAVTSNSQSGTNGGSLYQPEGNILAAGANQNTVKLAQNIDITGMGASAMDPPTNSQKMQDFNLAVSSAYGQVPQGSATPVV